MEYLTQSRTTLMMADGMCMCCCACMCFDAMKSEKFACWDVRC